MYASIYVCVYVCVLVVYVSVSVCVYVGECIRVYVHVRGYTGMRM